MRILLLLVLIVRSSLLAAQAPKDLEGLEFRGTDEAEHQEGCEGCGNPGHVEFEADGRVNFTLPGSDIIELLRYDRKGDVLHFAGNNWTMEFKGDTLLFTAYDQRHVYLRVRE